MQNEKHGFYWSGVLTVKGQKKKNDQNINKTLTRHIKVDQALVFANFVFSRTLVHDRNTGVANVKPAHYLWVKTKDN